MKAITAILLIWVVGLDAFKLTQIIENAEEEILQEMKEYNENKEPTRFYKSRKVTPESRAMGLTNSLFRKIKRYLIEDGLSEDEASKVAGKAVQDRQESIVKTKNTAYPAGQSGADGNGPGSGLSMVPPLHLREDRCRNVTITCNNSLYYREFDGKCNNLEYPLYGAASTAFIRAIKRTSWNPKSVKQNHEKLNFFRACNQRNENQAPKFLPSPRLVSTSVHKAATDISDLSLTHMVTQMAQFLDHDIAFTPEEVIPMNCCLEKYRNHNNCFNVDIPSNDPFYSTLKPPETCMSLHISTRFCEQNKDIDGHGEQFNGITAFVDASNVYASNPTDNVILRNQGGIVAGALKVTKRKDGNLLPKIGNTNPEFRAGDTRAPEMPGLLSMHTIWLREHNRIADIVRQELMLRTKTYPEEEDVFQPTRHIVTALMQKVIYGEWLPVILGKDFVQNPKNNLNIPLQGTTYNPKVNPSIENGFATAAFRFGHSMLQGATWVKNHITDERKIELIRDNLMVNDNYVAVNGVDDIMYGLTQQPAEKMDAHVTEDVTNFLFKEEGAAHGGDLVARNIQRGRIHSLPSYLAYRAKFSGKKDDTTNLCHKPPHGIKPEDWKSVMEIYNAPQDIDLFTGGLLEDPVKGSILGPTFHGILADQFRRLRDGDRFFFTHTNVHGSLSEAARKYVLGRTFSDILCDHTKIKNIQPDVFRLPKHKGNAVVSCVRRRDRNKDDLIRIIKEDNLILKCPKGLTNRPKCDKCADGYTGNPPNCKKEPCEDKVGHCTAFLCGQAFAKSFVSQNCRKTCGICKGGKKKIGSSKSHTTDCKQSSWGEWSKCSKSCGKGVQERTRTIVTPAKNGGKACSGPNKEEKACNIEACPECKDKSEYCASMKWACGFSLMKEFVTVNCRKTCGICKGAPTDCKYSSWGEWSKCSKSCGNGLQERTRTIVTEAQNGGKACVGNTKDTRLCNNGGCPVNCAWSNWGKFSECNKSCGIGSRERTRTVATTAKNGGNECVGRNRDKESCNLRACPVHCAWSDWAEWSRCSKSCGGGSQERRRNEKVGAKHGGDKCIGSHTARQSCNNEKCPVHCEWSNWGQWSKCTKSCGGGTQERKRTEATTAKHGGNGCDGSNTARQSCNDQNCPVHCKWSSWGRWSECSKSCGGGSQEKRRTEATTAKYGGRECRGRSYRTRSCKTQHCPVPCKWNSWGRWKPCSKSCGLGVRISKRTKVPAKYGGKKCRGSNKRSVSCNQGKCPVKCKDKNRKCDLYERKGYCTKQYVSWMATNCQKTCKKCRGANCKWGNWTKWTSCSKSCGGGSQRRTRKVAKYAQPGGRKCSGSKRASRSCNTKKCPRGDCTNKKGNYYCKGLKRRNYCERKPSFMARNCQKTCDKKCQQKGNGGNSGNSCINKKGDKYCEGLKDRDFCNRKGSFMGKNCKKACNWCQTSSSNGNKCDCKNCKKLSNGTCYYFSDNKKSFSQAGIICRSKGGKMVEPKDRKTSKIVNDVARSQFRTSFYWIGIKEVGRSWKWASDSSSVSDINWFRGEPDHPRTKPRCVKMRRGIGRMDDFCSSSLYFICEILTGIPEGLLKKKPCKNKYGERCNGWQGQGFCDSGRYVSWMSKNCKKACKKC